MSKITTACRYQLFRWQQNSPLPAHAASEKAGSGGEITQFLRRIRRLQIPKGILEKYKIPEIVSGIFDGPGTFVTEELLNHQAVLTINPRKNREDYFLPSIQILKRLLPKTII